MGVQTRPRVNGQAPITQVPLPRRQAAREALGVGVVLLLAILLRLVLAARAWPLINSDEATLGLMADDIRWHGAHPVFFYGQQYMGALQAYLAVPVFAVFGPTVLALHILTTVQFALFALALYAFTRAVYSPAVAWLTLLLLAFGPPSSLFFELRAGAGTQDTLLFGALLLWLTLARLRHPPRRRTRLTLDSGIGLAAGLAVWGDFLILPFVATCVGALAAESLRRGHDARDGQRLAANMLHPLAGGVAFLLGAAPLLAANMASHGATFAQALSKTGVSAAVGHPALLDAFVALPWQIAATLLVGIPHLLGSSVLCAQCAIWPMPHYQGTAVAALGAVAVALPFVAGALAAWAFAAWLLARDMRRRLPSRSQATRGVMREPAPPIDPRWWGRPLLVVAMALTVLAYMASPVSYHIPAGSGRYLVGLYVGAPLVAAPLWQGLVWLREHHAPRMEVRRWWSRPLVAGGAAAALVVLLVGLDLAAVASAFAQSQDQANYGIPAGARTTKLMAFLASHSGTQFYTTYWVCDVVMFASAERLQCGVTQDANALAPGLNRAAGAWARVRSSAHPAYVFDVQGEHGLPPAERQVAMLLARGDPRLAGYRTANIGGYVVFYFAG